MTKPENINEAINRLIRENYTTGMTDRAFQKMVQRVYTECSKELDSGKYTGDTDDYLFIGYNTEGKQAKLRYFKKSLELDEFNYDALLWIIKLTYKKDTDLVLAYETAVQDAALHMKEEGYFTKDNIGHFWGLLYTRPYMRLRLQYVNALIKCSMYKKALEECRDMIRLNRKDNLGMRFKLMFLYAYFEDGKAALDLYKEYDCYDAPEMLLALSIIYYKANDFKNAKKYLRKLRTQVKDTNYFFTCLKFQDLKARFPKEFPNSYPINSLAHLIAIYQENKYIFEDLESYIEWTSS